MPFYRCNIDSPLSAAEAVAHIRQLVGKPPGFWEAFRRNFGARNDSEPAFFGEANADPLRIYHNIRYRNSLLSG